jgi:ABC-2 type transport system ATP-binding protein
MSTATAGQTLDPDAGLGRHAIEVCDLKKTYARGAVEAVKGITFEVAPGEVFGLLGPNGAGKSTTIGVLTTNVEPTGGTAYVAGFDVVADPLRARQAASVVFQDATVDRGLTALRNLDTHARLWGLRPADAKRQIGELIDLFGLTEIAERPVATYSGGERRRLEIARALVSQPEVLFLDEPTVGLDPRIRHELLDVIRDLRAQFEMTILMTTHYLGEAEHLCDRIAIMHLGKIVALDTPAALLASLGHEIVEVRLSDDPLPVLEALQAQGAAGADAFGVGSTLTVPLHDSAGVEVMGVIHKLELPSIVSMSSRQPNLDDVYLRLTGDRLTDAA